MTERLGRGRQVWIARGIDALFGAEANDLALKHHANTFKERNRSRVKRLCFSDDAREPHAAKGVPERKLNRFRREATTLILGQQCKGHFGVFSVVMLVKGDYAQ